MADKGQIVTPYICCRGAARALEFYTKGFGAKELMRIAAPGGKIGHAEIRIGAGIVRTVCRDFDLDDAHDGVRESAADRDGLEESLADEAPRRRSSFF